MKKISVITPSFNSVKYIKRAIDSVLAQNYDNFEHIVVDGLSTDGTIDILKEYKHLKWISEADSGQSDAMNKGFAISTGDIIVYLNADDYFYEDIFKTVASYFENGEEVVVGKVEVLKSNQKSRIQDPSIEYIDILKFWENKFPLNPVQYFYLREIQENISFNEQNHYSMDHEFLLNVAQRYKFKKLDKVFGVFDMNDESKSVNIMKEPIRYFENFEYIDDYLTYFSSKQIIEFKNEQQRSLLVHTLWYSKQGMFIDEKIVKQYSLKIFHSIVSLLEDLTGKRIVIYGVGTLFEAIQKLFAYTHFQIDTVVDSNAKIVGKKIDEKNAVKDISELKNIDTESIILVTSVGYKKDIIKTIREMNNNNEVIFIEDYILYTD